MITRTWPYGTRKQVKVLDRGRDDGRPFLIAGELPNFVELFVLVFDRSHADALAAKIGDAGEITFTAGGPTGGYWDYEAKGTV